MIKRFKYYNDPNEDIAQGFDPMPYKTDEIEVPDGTSNDEAKEIYMKKLDNEFVNEGYIENTVYVEDGYIRTKIDEYMFIELVE